MPENEDLKISCPKLPERWETPRLIIRDAVETEIEALSGIIAATSYVLKWEGKIGEVAPDYIEKMLKQGDLPPFGTRKNFRLQTIILSVTGEIIGYIEIYHGYPEPDVLWIASLDIHPSFQQLGLGTEIIEALCAQTKTLSFYRSLRLCVALKNYPALRFWTTTGFDHIIKFYGEKLYNPKTRAGFVLERYL